MTDFKLNGLDTGLLLMRLAFGFRLIYGTIDNIVSWEQMLEFRDFLINFGFPMPLVAAVMSVYIQFVAGILWIIGYRVREASLVMILNFLVAIIMVHFLGGDSYIGTAPAIHLLVISVVLFLVGGGSYSLDAKRNRTKT